MPDLETQIRRYARHAVGTITPVHADDIRGLSRTGSRRPYRTVSAIAVAGVAVLLAATAVIALRARPVGVQVVGGEQDATPVSVRNWTPPEPGWALVVESLEPSDAKARAGEVGEIHLWDLDSGVARGTIRVGLSTEAALSNDNQLYLLTTHVDRGDEGQHQTYLSAVDLREGEMRWSRPLQDVWSTWVRSPANHLTVSSDGAWVVASRGLKLVSYASESGQKRRVADLSGRCTRSIRDVETSWEPREFFVLCGDELLRFSAGTGHVEELTSGVPDLLPDYRQLRGFPPGGERAGSASALVVDREHGRITLLLSDARLVRINRDGDSKTLGEPSRPLLPGGASTMVAPMVGRGDSIVTPLVGPEFCRPCAGRVGADHLIAVDGAAQTVEHLYRHPRGILDLELSPDHRYIYVVDATNYDIVVMDAESLQSTKEISIGGHRVSELMLIN